MRHEEPIDGEHRVDVACGSNHDRADFRIVHAQPQQRIVELAKRAKGPELIAHCDDGIGRRRHRFSRPLNGQIRRPLVAVEGNRYGRVPNGIGRDCGGQRVQRDAGPCLRAIG